MCSCCLTPPCRAAAETAKAEAAAVAMRALAEASSFTDWQRKRMTSAKGRLKKLKNVREKTEILLQGRGRHASLDLDETPELALAAMPARSRRATAPAESGNAPASATMEHSGQASEDVQGLDQVHQVSEFTDWQAKRMTSARGKLARLT